MSSNAKKQPALGRGLSALLQNAETDITGASAVPAGAVALISIDLIENAFKHADLQNSDAFISIVFEFNDNVFYMTVSNKISPKTPLKKEKSGIGAETLEQRLRIIYKDNFKLERFTEGDVFIAHLKINLLEHKAKMLAIR
jgi:LytS/YehU family sensor histidine kinase